MWLRAFHAYLRQLLLLLRMMRGAAAAKLACRGAFRRSTGVTSKTNTVSLRASVADVAVAAAAST